MASCGYCGDLLPGEETFHDDCFVYHKIKSQEELSSPERVWLEFGHGTADKEFAEKFPDLPVIFS